MQPPKPLTDTQLARNRANAQKSTGPRTPEGKRNSSQNAISHGCLARTVLLPDEAAGAFYTLIRSYTRRFRPVSQDEHDLVETMAVCRWRILRVWTLEAASILHEQSRQEGPSALSDPPTRALLALRNLNHPPRPQEALARHEVRLDRAYHRAADRLREIQASRKKEEAERTQQLTENKVTLHKNEPASNPERSAIEPITKPERTAHFTAFIRLHRHESRPPLSSSNSQHLTTTHSYFIIDSEPTAAQAALAEFITI